MGVYGVRSSHYDRSVMDTNVKAAAKAVWWLVLLRGIFMVIFGIIALVSPGIALLTLVWVFGFYAILDGISAVVIGIRLAVLHDNTANIIVDVSDAKPGEFIPRHPG